MWRLRALEKRRDRMASGVAPAGQALGWRHQPVLPVHLAARGIAQRISGVDERAVGSELFALTRERDGAVIRSWGRE